VPPNPNNLPRFEKDDIIARVLGLVTERQQKGPEEPGLDAFIPQLTAVAEALRAHVTGRVLAEGARETQLARAEAADVWVDTRFRHIEAFLSIEAGRRSGPDVDVARGLYNAACPDGLAHVDDHMRDQNMRYADTLAVLKDPENAGAIAALNMPPSYIDAFEAALNESNAALDALTDARGEKNTHIELGRDAEAAWSDVMTRLRHYIDSRAPKSDAAKVAEGKALIKPLLDAMARQKAEAAARATRRKKGAAEPAPKPAGEAPKPGAAQAPVGEAPKPGAAQAPVGEAPKPGATQAPTGEAPKPVVIQPPARSAPAGRAAAREAKPTGLSAWSHPQESGDLV
jgi:hypothetical protein